MRPWNGTAGIPMMLLSEFWRAGVTAETGKLTLSGAVLEITADAGGIDLLGSLTIENQTRLTVKKRRKMHRSGRNAGNFQLSTGSGHRGRRNPGWQQPASRTPPLTITGLDEYNDEGGMHALITKDGDLIVEKQHDHGDGHWR